MGGFILARRVSSPIRYIYSLAKLSCKPRSATMGVIEPRETFLERYPLMLAKILVDPQRDVIPIRIMNPTRQ